MGKINYFDDIKIGNEIFSLSHLNPKYLEFYGQKVQKTLKLKVLYSDHCFTARVNRSVSDSVHHFWCKNSEGQDIGFEPMANTSE